MKAKLIFASLLIAATAVFSAGLRPSYLQWDDPNPAGFVVSYRIYQADGTNYTLLSTVATNNWTVVLSGGQHAICVSAVGVDGQESDKSTNINIIVLMRPINLKLITP